MLVPAILLNFIINYGDKFTTMKILHNVNHISKNCEQALICSINPSIKILLTAFVEKYKLLSRLIILYSLNTVDCILFRISILFLKKDATAVRNNTILVARQDCLL
jgi:hypothetical protein